MAARTPAPPQLDRLHMILIVAGVFAIGSVGFFLAILWGNISNKQPTSNVQKQFTIEEKSQIVDSLNVADASTSGAQASTSAAKTVVAHGQADAKDPNAAKKIDILNSLNAK